MILKQNIKRLDVTVHDFNIMQVLEPLGNVQKDAASKNFSLFYRLWFPPLQIINQCAASIVSGDNVVRFAVFDSLHKTYNIFAFVFGRVKQTLNFLKFFRVPSVEFIGGLLANDLDSVLVVWFQVMYFVNFALTAFANCIARLVLIHEVFQVALLLQNVKIKLFHYIQIIEE